LNVGSLYWTPGSAVTLAPPVRKVTLHPFGASARDRGGMRLRSAAILVVILLTGACSSDDGGDVSSGGTSTEASTTAAPASGPTTPDTTPAGTEPAGTEPATTPTTASPTTGGPTSTVTGDGPTSVGDPGITCEGAPTPADVDGDGIDDAIIATAADDGFPIVEVCPSGSVGGFVLQPTGEGELSFADIDGDGAAEILYGGTQAMSRTVGVARMVDGALMPVIRTDGVPITLVDGYPEGLPPDGPRLAFGCDDHDTGRVLVTLELNEIDRDGSPVIDGVWSAYELDGPVVQQVDTAPVTAEGYDDTQTMLDELVASWAPPC
jgi:hypothetical protein